MRSHHPSALRLRPKSAGGLSVPRRREDEKTRRREDEKQFSRAARSVDGFPPEDEQLQNAVMDSLLANVDCKNSRPDLRDPS